MNYDTLIMKLLQGETALEKYEYLLALIATSNAVDNFLKQTTNEHRKY